MSTPAVIINGTSVPQRRVNERRDIEELDYTEKYAQERQKRLGKGMKQYRQLEKSKDLLKDPWLEAGTPIDQVISNGDHRKVLIVGAGYGGILFAVNLIKTGFQAGDIVIVDPAGGFGGTWYWNRYPGLMCDVEAYIYMPLLEEMNYMPKHKYAKGEELRLYAERICQKYSLDGSGLFQSSVKRMTWDNSKQHWALSIEQNPKGGEKRTIDVSADFVIIANGVLDNAKVPNTPGTEDFKGKMFHTSRWHYDVTGGSTTEPEMTKLQDKRVGIIGTGATGVQVVPQLAKWSKHLYVFQRTPSSVDVRGNRETDATEWKTKIATGPGWQRERNMNWFKFVCNNERKPDVNLVDDEWTRTPSYSAIIGGPDYNVTMENVGSHIARMHALDKPHMDHVRNRVEKVVKDAETAKGLQAWYPGWCKRPCFHDDYLPAFNRPNVTLVDTDGQGIDRLTPNGVEYGGKEYEVDVLVFGTGFTSPGVGTQTSRAGIECIGAKGETLDQQFQRGMSTLHGVVTREFPNMFWPGINQSGASPNQMFLLETLSAHTAYIISEATKRVGGTPVIQPTVEGEQDWTMRIMAGAVALASARGCTPGYQNREGESDEMTQEEQALAARQAPWTKGIADFVRVLEEWEAEGKMEGLEFTAKA